MKTFNPGDSGKQFHRMMARSEVTRPGSLSRRTFLKMTGAVGAGLGLPGGVSLGGHTGGRLYDGGSREIPGGATGDVSNVIVVGAGFAGLAAGRALTTEGVDVTVLEGRSRIGGRAHTIQVGAAPVDLGCKFIHNPGAQNSMARFANQVGIGTIPVDVVDGISAHDSGLMLDLTAEELEALLDQITAFDLALVDLLAQLGSQASLADAIEAHLNGIGATGDFRRQVKSILWLVATQDESAPPEEASLQTYTEIPYAFFAFGRTDVFPEGGYSVLANALADGLDIRLEAEVSQIAYDANGVTVVTSDSQVFEGSHVVVTVPLGVLKAGSSALQFTPGLPATKVDAIDRLGFGNFFNAIVRFDQAFWQGSRGHFLHFDEPSGELIQNHPLWIDYDSIYGIPALACWGAGAFGADAESRPRPLQEAAVEDVLENVFGSIPTPQEFVFTDWGNDPFTRGAYSTFGPSADGSEMDTLSEPVSGRVLFAGEATMSRRYATADGAFDSGIREAKRLLGQRTVRVDVASS